jgi:hypothetical protein
MATEMQTLRRKAKSAGVSASDIRAASSVAELKALIADNGTPRKAVAKKAVKKAVKRTAVKKSATKAPAAKSTTGKAKRPSTTAKSGKAGRNLISTVDFDKTKGWNPRAGSAPDRIMKALKKVKGNRTKAFEALRADVWDFVGKVKRNGERRTKAEAEAMLKYRISRTLFDFVNQTKQHKISTNRIEYGTGPNAQPKRGRPKATAKAAVTAPKRRGRPPGSKNKVQTQAAKKGRSESAKRGRGRPKGSKNKPK